MLMAVTLLPLPDSPTSATVLLAGMSKLTPFTACAVWVLLMRKETLRSCTLISGFMCEAQRSLGSSASRSASVNSAKAVTNAAMNPVAAANCHHLPKTSSV